MCCAFVGLDYKGRSMLLFCFCSSAFLNKCATFLPRRHFLLVSVTNRREKLFRRVLIHKGFLLKPLLFLSSLQIKQLGND